MSSRFDYLWVLIERRQLAVPIFLVRRPFKRKVGRMIPQMELPANQAIHTS
jgi:hypothetical protein